MIHVIVDKYLASVIIHCFVILDLLVVLVTKLHKTNMRPCKIDENRVIFD